MDTSAYKNAYGYAYDPNAIKNTIDLDDATQYSYMTENERVFSRSHMYGGSHHRDERTALVYDQNVKTLVYKKVTTPKLQERLFLELISNAIDNAFKSQRMNVPAPTLDVQMDGDTISVRSTGMPIPVQPHSYYTSQGIMGTCAELIFSKVGGGGNMDDTKAKKGGGINGVGSTLTNIFSRVFQAEIGDNVRGFKQTIGWAANMTQKVIDKIEPAYNISPNPDSSGNYHLYPVNQAERYNGENYVLITFKVDFRKFGREYYVEEDMQLYMKYVLEASYISKLKTTFNGMCLTAKTPTQFINMIPKELQKACLIHYALFQDVNVSQKQIEDAVSKLQIAPELELIIIDSPGKDNIHISYTNGVWNSLGGVHTDAVYRAILDIVKSCITQTKGMKDVDLKNLTIREIKAHCTVIINYRCNDPDFKGQDKERLNKPEPKIKFKPEEVARIKKFALVQCILQSVTGKILKGYSVNTGRIKGDDTFTDAVWFGSPKQNQCVMLICEGKSAGAYVKDWIYGTADRTNKFCYFLLTGKILNVTGKDLAEILDEKNPGGIVIRKIIKCMGLEYGVDYRTEEGAKRLRYQQMWAMTDSDSDGFHIQSLVKNILYVFYPTFLMSGRFRYIPTPVMRILTAKSKGKTKEIFYTMSAYEAYVKRTGDTKHHAKHFKGLASGGKEYAKEDARVSPIVTCNYDQYAGYFMDIAFGKDKDSANKRKVWVENGRNTIDSEIVKNYGSSNGREKYVDISDYLNTRLVEYSIDSFKRALPCAYDGLKLSQRQSIWYIVVAWKYGHSTKGAQKLASIAGEAATATKYHHGDLSQTIARFAQRFPGSNNVPLLTIEDGQFGSREEMGSDIGAPRYISTEPEDIVKLLFDEELIDMVPRRVEESKDVEPYWLPCKIALHAANGALGVATAYSIDQPPYHPMDLCQWQLNYITGQDVFPMVPWYMGFNGTTHLELVKGKHKADKELLSKGQEYVEYYEGLTVVTMGVFQVLQERQALYDVEDPNNPGKTIKVQKIVRDILITEIPINVATKTYIAWLSAEDRCDLVDNSMTTSTETPIIKIIGWRGEVSYKALKLIKRQGINNISLIDDKGIPIQLRNVYQMLKIYCDNMVNLYKDLKTKRLKDLNDKINDEIIICKLIELVITDKILVFRQKRSKIFEQMATYGIEQKFYEKIGLKGLDEDGYAEHMKKLEELRHEYAIIDAKHHLYDWCEDLGKIYQFFAKQKEYKKLPQHEYPFRPVNIQQLISGNVKSPYNLKEEVVPIKLDIDQMNKIQNEKEQFNVDNQNCQMVQQQTSAYVDPVTGQYVYYDSNTTSDQIESQIENQVKFCLHKTKEQCNYKPTFVENTSLYSQEISKKYEQNMNPVTGLPYPTSHSSTSRV